MSDFAGQSENIHKNSSMLKKTSVALHGAGIWALRQVGQKHLENVEMWCWRIMEVIIWADHVRSEEVLRTVKEDKNILHTTKRMKVSWIVPMQ